MTQVNPQFTQWLDIAQKDFDVAKHLYEIFRPMPLEIICYQCQQAGEKALKAMYILLEIPGGVPKTHDLSLLLDQMHKSVTIPHNIYDDADEISPYATAARYPSDTYFDEHGTKKAIKCAEEILAWVKNYAGIK